MVLMEKSKDFLKMLFFLGKMYYNSVEDFLEEIHKYPFLPKRGKKRWEKLRRKVQKK